MRNSILVTNNYDTKTKKLYTNYVIFGFEIPDNNGGNSVESKNKKATAGSKGKVKTNTKTKATNKADVIQEDDEDELPF